ncbi:hypothetical protein Tco_0320339 [Tanacetum coccineum]
MTRLCRARMTVKPQTPLSAFVKACIVEYAVAPTPPSTSPSPLTSYLSLLPQIPSPLLHVPSPPLLVPSPPLLLPSADHGSDIPDDDMPPRKRVCLTAPTFRVMIAVEEVNERVTDLAATERQDAHGLYVQAVYARHAWAHSESRRQAMEARIRALQRDFSVLQRQRIDDGDRLTSHIQHDHDKFKELARTRDVEHQDRPADASSSC